MPGGITQIPKIDPPPPPRISKQQKKLCMDRIARFTLKSWVSLQDYGDVEEVGRSIQSKLDGSLFTKPTMKRADQVKTFSHLKNAVKINKQNIVIDPSKLFTRLIVLLERCDDITPYFQYELTPVPTLLFLDNMMRKPNKSSLIQPLLGRDYQLVGSNDIISTENNVVDGGDLPRKIIWKQDTTFENNVETLWEVCTGKI